MREKPLLGRVSSRDSPASLEVLRNGIGRLAGVLTSRRTGVMWGDLRVRLHEVSHAEGGAPAGTGSKPISQLSSVDNSASTAATVLKVFEGAGCAVTVATDV